MRNPKVSVEKAQGKGLLYSCSKCPLSDELWYTHFPSPYGCCHGSGLQGGLYYHPEPTCHCSTSTQTNSDKSKGCKVRKWKMLSRHHSEKQRELEPDLHHLGGCQAWGVHTAPLLASPVMLECSICSGPYISYALEDTWQPRQRTQAMDLYYHNDSETDNYCCPSDNTFMKQRRMGLNDFIQRLATNSYACKHPEVTSILNLPQDAELMNANPSPPPSPSQQINLGPSSNPSAKPSDFHFLKVIGKGSFGKVLLARHRSDDQFYAVKVLQKKAILKKKEEKHIIRQALLRFGLHQRWRVVLPPPKGTLLPGARARFYAAEIASALGYLHSLNIVYRDLKPENILLDSQGHIILTDFGLCKENIEPNGTTSTFCGTPEYLAPEVLHKQPYDRTVDWWCLGAVLYEMLYGLPPFYSRNTAEMYDNILNKPLQLKPNISNAARHLLEGLLQKDRTKRLGCKDDFLEIKTHIFFSPINWDDLNAKRINPPFNPNVTGPNDLRHFDPEFTDEPVPSSIGCSPDSTLVTASIKEASEAFVGFSYAPSMDSYL
ncbi:hypothetical protein WMY93_015459 [Mugilogobius chulae]|uniref:Serum/glucocorticoid regulated kinase 1 n=1 Tax=Mugilogobius chulae TaxID=88201 RepID=A0AAW0NSU4_9GOBI